MSNDLHHTPFDAAQSNGLQATGPAFSIASPALTALPSPKSHWFLIGVLGAVAGIIAHNAVHFSGWSPLLLGGLGLLLAVMIGLCTRQRRWSRLKRWSYRAGSLLILGLLLVGVAYMTKFPDRTRAFTELFGALPPAQVHGLRVVRGWYDGPIITYEFKIDQPTLNWLLTSPATRPISGRGAGWHSAPWIRKTEDDSMSSQRMWSKMRFGCMINPAWQVLPSLSSPILYERQYGTDVDPDSKTAYVIWEPSTQTAYAATWSDY